MKARTTRPRSVPKVPRPVVPPGPRSVQPPAAAPAPAAPTRQKVVHILRHPWSMKALCGVDRADGVDTVPLAVALTMPDVLAGRRLCAEDVKRYQRIRDINLPERDEIEEAKRPAS